MNIRAGRHRGILLILLILLAAPWGALGGLAQAQQAAGPPVELPKPDDIEPGVDTSASAGSAPSPAAPSAATPQVARPAGERGAPIAAARPAAKPGAPPGPKAEDRLDLDTTQITGNRELPKVLYIVPWKRPDIGDLSGRPPNTLVEEILAPVDRDVFQRENRYYEALKPDSPHASDLAGRGSETAEPAAETPRTGP